MRARTGFSCERSNVSRVTCPVTSRHAESPRTCVETLAEHQADGGEHQQARHAARGGVRPPVRPSVRPSASGHLGPPILQVQPATNPSQPRVRLKITSCGMEKRARKRGGGIELRAGRWVGRERGSYRSYRSCYPSYRSSVSVYTTFRPPVCLFAYCISCLHHGQS